jgi:hypothetical protein
MMQPGPPDVSRRDFTESLLLLLILSLPLMKPAIGYSIVLPDLVFVALFLAFVAQIAGGKRRLAWKREYWILPIYVASFVPSLLATPDVGQSLFKLLTQLYLVALALVTAMLIRSEAHLRWAVMAWLLGTAIVAAVGVASLAIFPFAPGSALVDYARFHFGTLPPGAYLRLSSTFLNANMACNYLSISAVLLLAARTCGWVSGRVFLLLFAATVITALATISPGLGGLALVVGMWLWLMHRGQNPIRARLALFSAVVAAAAFVLAVAVTPVLHPTAPFLIAVPGTDLVLAPSGRWMLWSGSLAEFLRQPLFGHGIGIDATYVRYLDPSGNLQILTDAHNVYLSIAAQCGVSGLLGLGALLAYAWSLTPPWRLDGATSVIRVALGLSFLGAFAYQGISGSFEDTRHLWVLLGLLIAASGLTRADGNNRRAGAPSPC